MKNKYALIGLLILTVAVSGCTTQQQNPEAKTEKEQMTDDIKKVTFTDDGEKITCYISDGVRERGMSCVIDKYANR